MMRFLAVGALLLAGSVGSAQAATITFEDQGFVPTLPNNAEPRNGDLTSGGFFFDMAGRTPLPTRQQQCEYQQRHHLPGDRGGPSLVTFSQVAARRSR